MTKPTDRWVHAACQVVAGPLRVYAQGCVEPAGCVALDEAGRDRPCFKACAPLPRVLQYFKIVCFITFRSVYMDSGMGLTRR